MRSARSFRESQAVPNSGPEGTGGVRLLSFRAAYLATRLRRNPDRPALAEPDDFTPPRPGRLWQRSLEETMTKHLSLFAIVFGVALGLAYGPPADATPLLEDTYADAAPCRLQDDRECLQVLKRLAAAGAQRRSAEPDFYAVLVNGDTSPLHNANVERAYHVLRALSVPDNNIHVLSNSDPRTGHDAEAGPRVNARATTANLANVLGFLAREVDDNDCLLVYTTGHGIREQRQSALCLNDGLILEDELVRYMRS